MPCTYYSESEIAGQNLRALKLATRIACEAVAKLSQEALADCSAELRAWKEEHDEMDRKRLASEKAAKDRLVKADAEREDRERALASLTAEQRKALKL